MASAEAQNVARETAQEYYRSTLGSASQQSFENLDDQANFDTLMQAAQSSKTRNFILDFSDATSWVSFDVSTTRLNALLDSERPDSLSTRWINIWYPQTHKGVLESLAKRYDFSPRLLALITSDPRLPRHSHTDQPNKKHHHRLWRHRSRKSSSESDVEKGSDELEDHASLSSYDSVQQGNLYKVVNELWHYSSIDLGRNYMCIGYNSLYGTKHAGQDVGGGLLPYCTRVWTWLLLCEDNTVISINEDIFPFSDGHLDSLQQRILAETRRNLINVFRSLSAVEEKSLMAKHPMSLFPIRMQLGDTPEEAVHRQSDAPGLLFYYLFENWHNSYTLVTRKESRYGVELSNLRAEMFKLPKLCHIDRLDSIGTELGVLRRHYESYNRLIDRLLEPQAATTASLQNSRVVSEASHSSLDTVRPVVTEKESMLGVSMTSAARVRFKRLQDLIDLYALSEVEEYIKQKESLVAMNFNLIAIKESLDVERLTRVTLLLTKITILFLPVSLMTSYFGVQLIEMTYTVKQYWISFAVILFLSWFTLLVLGVLSGGVETKTVWKALWSGMKGTNQWVKSRI